MKRCSDSQTSRSVPAEERDHQWAAAQQDGRAYKLAILVSKDTRVGRERTRRQGRGAAPDLRGALESFERTAQSSRKVTIRPLRAPPGRTCGHQGADLLCAG